MATQLQLRRGTKAQNDAFTGAVAELTYDTDTKALRVHDGSTVGGIYVGTVRHCSFNTNTRIKITTTDQIAAKNGWLVGVISFSGTNQSLALYLNSQLIARYGYSNGAQWFAASVFIPIKAGQAYRYTCSGTVEGNDMYFYPDD